MIHVAHTGPYGVLSEQFMCLRQILREQFPYHSWTWMGGGGGKKEYEIQDTWGGEKNKLIMSFL